MSETMRLVFPCGAYFPIKEWPLRGAHYAKDGAVQMNVHPGTSPYAERDVWTRHFPDYDKSGEHHMPCLLMCPTPKRRRVQRGFDAHGKLGYYVSCHGRLNELTTSLVNIGGTNTMQVGWEDVTPQAPATCPHCQEQRAYVAACERAARDKTEAPDREKWGQCPQCGRHRELTTDTGLCAKCQTVTPLVGRIL